MKPKTETGEVELAGLLAAAVFTHRGRREATMSELFRPRKDQDAGSLSGRSLSTRHRGSRCRFYYPSYAASLLISSVLLTDARGEPEVVLDLVTEGRLALADGRPNAARDLCRKAALTPRRSDALTCLGEVELEEGRYQLAVRLGAAALKIRGSIATHLLIARGWQALAHCEWATPHFEQVLIVEPDNQLAVRGLAVCQDSLAAVKQR